MIVTGIPDKLKTEIVVEWLIKNLTWDIISLDAEDSEYGTLYNLVHLARDGEGFEIYDYEPWQDEEIEGWKLEMGVE